MRLKAAALTVCVLLAGAGLAPTAEAARSDGRNEVRSSSAQRAPVARNTQVRQASRTRAGSGGGISCVPYARSITGMTISGNGRDWWHNAAGRYARGQRPEIGSILSFPSSGGMRSGHVAVVSRVVNGRMIEIDHANWGGPGIRRGQVMRGVKVMDVSDDNSWTRVRVQVGWTAENFGREYPTHGFIHNRPATSFAANEDMIRPASYTQREAVRPRAARAGQQARPAQTRSAPARTAQARNAGPRPAVIRTASAQPRR
jgi:surface antigen